MTIMRAISLVMLIGSLAGCVVDRDRGEGFDSDHGEHAFDRNRGYNDFRSQGPHGLDHLDRPD